MDELKRSYEYRLHDNATDTDEIKIKFIGNDYVEISGYKVRSYDDIVNLMESGAI